MKTENSAGKTTSCTSSSVISDGGMMKVQVLTAIGKLEFKEVPIPSIKADEVLVKIKTAAICNGSDPNIYNGHIPGLIPCIFGHEPFGEVVACGNKIESLKIGDSVTWWFSLGAFAEYAVVNPSKVAATIVPDSIGKTEAPILELVSASARAVKAAKIKPGSRVLILGLGPSGLIMSQLAKIHGASMVIGWDLYPMRRGKGLSLGCDYAFDPSLDSVGKLTKSELGEADIIIDAFGDDILPGEPTFDKAVKLLAYGGLVVSYGHPSKGRRINSFELQSKNAGICSPEQDMGEIRKLTEECVGFIIAGKLNIKTLVSATLPLSQISQGLEMVTEHPDSFLKIIIRIADGTTMT